MMTLRIECPKCQQNFEVGEDLQGRTVECGSCEHRFKVTPEVVSTTQRERFYPDESRKNTDLSRFGRAPASAKPVEFRTADYGKLPDQSALGPVPPVRVFAIVAGFLVFVAMSLVFYFGSQPNVSLLQDVQRPERLTLAGFFGLVGLVLLFWGMLRKRVVGFLLGIAGSAGLLALAYYLPVNLSPSFDGTGETIVDSGDEEATPKPPTFFPGITEKPLTPQEVMEMTRWKSAVLPLVSSGDEEQVVAVWVRAMEEFHRLQLQNYLKQEFDLANRPDFRVLRDGGLFVMSGSPFDLDRVEASVERFGEIEQVIPELRLIQMQVNATVLGDQSSSNEITNKLNNPSDGAFYSLNYAELIALDRERVKQAVIRLSNAEPVRMRKDITVRLVGLLGGRQDTETYGNLAQALNVWSEEGDGADRALVGLVGKMREQRQEVPDAILRFWAERKTPEAASLMVQLWAEDPVSRNRFVESYGSQAATSVSFYLRSSEDGLARSAARLMGQIGTKDHLPQMREALTGSGNEEFKRVLQEAIERVVRR